LKVPFSSIPEGEGLAVAFEGKDSAWDGLAGMGLLSLPRGSLIIERSGETVFIKGRVLALVRLNCSRCLEEFDLPLDLPIRHILRPVPPELPEAREVELQPEDLEYGYYQDDTVELDRIIEENLVLSFPMKPLCDEACKGLCPRCGNNLNRGACPCSMAEVDSPFVRLKNLVH